MSKDLYKSIRLAKEEKGYIVGSLNDYYYKKFGRNDNKYVMVHHANGKWWITYSESEVNDFDPNDSEELRDDLVEKYCVYFFSDFEFVEE